MRYLFALACAVLGYSFARQHAMWSTLLCFAAAYFLAKNYKPVDNDSTDIRSKWRNAKKWWWL